LEVEMTKPNPLEKLSAGDYEALANLIYALRRFTVFSTSEVQRLGITPQQHQALLAIKGLPDGKTMTIGMLADLLLIARDSATVLVQTLEEMQFIVRSGVKAGSQNERVTLTAKAEHILEQLSGAHLHEIREMAPELMHALRMLQDHRRLGQLVWMS